MFKIKCFCICKIDLKHPIVNIILYTYDILEIVSTKGYPVFPIEVTHELYRREYARCGNHLFSQII